jgi:hypothetical protein
LSIAGDVNTAAAGIGFTCTALSAAGAAALEGAGSLAGAGALEGAASLAGAGTLTDAGTLAGATTGKITVGSSMAAFSSTRKGLGISVSAETGRGGGGGGPGMPAASPRHQPALGLGAGQGRAEGLLASLTTFIGHRLIVGAADFAARVEGFAARVERTIRSRGRHLGHYACPS